MRSGKILTEPADMYEEKRLWRVVEYISMESASDDLV